MESGDIASLSLFRSIIKEFLKLIVFINSHERVYSLLETIGGAALLQAAPTRMGKEVLALQGVFKDKNKLEQLFVHSDIHDIVRTFKPEQKETFENLKGLILIVGLGAD